MRQSCVSSNGLGLNDEREKKEETRGLATGDD